MNQIEKVLMNNPIRAAFQKWYEAPLLEQLGGRVENLKVLEVGCGRGVGTELILDRFAAREVHSLDLDPDMIRRARARLARYPSERLILSVGDVTHLDAADATYDAVFDFAILHHIPVWQDAVTEIVRVLKPGGRFFFQEVTRHFLDKWFSRTFLEHPAENRFRGEVFIAELERQGLQVGSHWVTRGDGDYIFGVGWRK